MTANQEETAVIKTSRKKNSRKKTSLTLSRWVTGTSNHYVINNKYEQGWLSLLEQNIVRVEKQIKKFIDKHAICPQQNIIEKYPASL